MYNWLYTIIIYPVIFILPAYVANGAPVIFGKGSRPLTGATFRGRPLLGRHKTRRGLAAGICAGIIVGYLESLAPGFGYMLAVGMTEAVGTHFGDLLGSFMKRQAGVQEGHQVPVLDQYPFLAFALIFTLPIYAYYPGSFPSVYGIIFLFMLTWVMHRLTNLGAHRLKIKEVPW